MASAASVSMEISSTFVGLAKLRSYPISSVKTANFFSINRANLTAQSRKFLACTVSANSRIVSSSNQPKRQFFRRLTVASAATSAAETEDSGVVTKIPPDNRIPATIISGGEVANALKRHAEKESAVSKGFQLSLLHLAFSSVSMSRPLRKAVEKVRSYKEIPINIKTRRSY